MGNCCALCRASRNSCATIASSDQQQQQKDVLVVKMDGKILEFTAPIVVKDLLLKFPGLGIGVSKETPECLPLTYELKLGNIYFIVPLVCPVVHTQEQSSNSSTSSTSVMKTIRVVITKKQLQDLVSNKLSFDSVLSSSETNTTNARECCNNSSRGWRPSLESIPEGNLHSLAIV